MKNIWRKKNGEIRFDLPSTDRTTGPQWIKRLKNKGFRVGKDAKSILLSPNFKPTIRVVNQVAVLKGMLFEDNDRITVKIRAEAQKRGWTKPNAEIACLIRESFSDEELEAMGLWGIIAMHDPIKDSGGDPNLLGADRDGDGQWLNAYCDNPVDRWYRDFGFAFVASQVGA